jgi:hypothetical protein
MAYRDLNQEDEAAALKWYRENGIEPARCWGKDGTCQNMGNWFVHDHEGLYCTECSNVLLGN